MNPLKQPLKKIHKFLIFLLILTLCFILGRFIQPDLEYYRNLLSQYPLAISGILFVCLYVFVTFFIWFGAKDVFRIASAVLFGPYISTLFVWLGETLNAAILFQLSRKLGRDFVVEKFRLDARELHHFQADSDFLGIIAIRINPLIPFRFMDLGFGLSKMAFRKYLVAIIIASPFRILWLQYILSGIGESIFQNPALVLNYLVENPRVMLYSYVYFLLVIVLTIVAVVFKFLRKKKTNKRIPYV